MLENIDKMIENIVCDISGVNADFKALSLFADEIFEDVYCIPEPDVSMYVNSFNTQQIRAHAVMDYADKIRKRLTLLTEQSNIVFNYLTEKKNGDGE